MSPQIYVNLPLDRIDVYEQRALPAFTPAENYAGMVNMEVLTELRRGQLAGFEPITRQPGFHGDAFYDERGRLCYFIDNGYNAMQRQVMVSIPELRVGMEGWGESSFLRLRPRSIVLFAHGPGKLRDWLRWQTRSWLRRQIRSWLRGQLRDWLRGSRTRMAKAELGGSRLHLP